MRKTLKPIFKTLTILLLLANSFWFIASVVELLRQWIGWFAFILWTFVAPMLSPAAIILPWFDAWVWGHDLDHYVLGTWLGLIACMIANLFIGTWEDD